MDSAERKRVRKGRHRANASTEQWEEMQLIAQENAVSYLRRPVCRKGYANCVLYNYAVCLCVGMGRVCASM